MQLNLNRLDEVLFIFGRILPLGNLEKQKKLQDSLNLQIDIDQAVAILMRAIHTMMKQNPSEALGYLDFVKQSIEYVFEESDKRPEVDELDEQVFKIYEIQKKDYEKDD